MDDHVLIGEKLHVYKRGPSPFWQCSVYLAGRNHRTSTKERDLPHAKRVAEDWYLTLQIKNRAGELKGGPTFAAAARIFEAEYAALVAGERNPEYVKSHGDRLRVHLLPFFGAKAVEDINTQMVQDYRVHRMTSRTRKRVRQEGGRKVVYEEVMRPSKTTMHHEIITLRHVLKTAMRKGWIKFVPDLSPAYRGSSKISHRAWFNPDEYKQLYNATRERAANPPKPRWKWECEQLHDFVLFIVNTGLRPDEVGHLQFRDVEVVRDDPTQQTILEIAVRGKRGTGYCKSMPGAVLPFERLRARKRVARKLSKQSWGGGEFTEDESLNPPQPSDLLFPDLREHHLNAVLEELNMKFDREGQRRSAYSLRHTYICLRLMEGADIYQIAKNCRTSVEMIEKFYAAHLKNMIDASAVNVRRAAPAASSKRGANAKRPSAARPIALKKAK